MEIKIPDLVWAIINFLVLLAILNKFLHKPILDMLEKRKNFVDENLSSSKAAKEEAEKLRADYEAQIKNAKQEANDIITKATKLGEESKNEIIETARNEAAKISAKAQEDIQREKAAAIAEIRDEVATLAVMAAEKIIGKTMDPKDHEKLVKDFVKEVGETH